MKNKSRLRNCHRVETKRGYHWIQSWKGFEKGISEKKKKKLVDAQIKPVLLFSVLIFSRAAQHTGSQFPDQGSNLRPLQW